MTKQANKEILWRHFDTLTTRQLYALLKLRQDVFVIEQQCIYAELDGEDFHHWHLLVMIDNELAGYLRVIPADFHSSGCVAIGRVVIAKPFRGQGLASELMQQTLIFCEEKFPGQLLFLSAQEHLLDFYKGFGFSSISEVYLEDGIPHIDMKRLPLITP